jgi:hypothetical protein
MAERRADILIVFLQVPNPFTYFRAALNMVSLLQDPI